MRSGKISVSLPGDLLKRIERWRLRHKWSRSRTIQHALEQWAREVDGEREVAAYIQGYLRNPEDAASGDAFVKAWASGQSREDWS